MPGGRYRELQFPVAASGGTAIDTTGGLVGDIHYPGPVTRKQWMSDVVGFPDYDNFLELTTSNFLAGYITGQNGFAYRDDAIAVTLDPYQFGNVWDGIPSDNALMTRAMSITSPFHAGWNGSSAVGQLKDFRHLPRQLKDIGQAVLDRKKPQSLLKAGADWNLLLGFGIAPFIQDLKSLLDFQDRCDNRLNDFHRMTEPGGGKRKATVWQHNTDSTFAGQGYFVGHYQANAQYKAYFRASVKSWGSVVWNIPKANLPPRGSSEEKYLANRLANGIDITPRTLWELMPWTWLGDWFTNIGDFIDLSYNIIGATSGRYCVMHHVRSEWHLENLSSCSFGGGNLSCDVKKRIPCGLVFPEVHLPFVTGNMASTLGNLAVQRWVK